MTQLNTTSLIALSHDFPDHKIGQNSSWPFKVILAPKSFGVACSLNKPIKDFWLFVWGVGWVLGDFYASWGVRKKSEDLGSFGRENEWGSINWDGMGCRCSGEVRLVRWRWWVAGIPWWFWFAEKGERGEQWAWFGEDESTRGLTPRFIKRVLGWFGLGHGREVEWAGVLFGVYNNKRVGRFWVILIR